jgi:DNA-binding transcriptional LysR family regulator
MHLDDISLFIRVVEKASFAAVAEELGMQRSSISRAVARLEEALGTRLLQRTTRKLALTDAGQVFFEQVRKAMSGVDDAVNSVREFGSAPRGNVRMTAPPDAEQIGLVDALTTFIAKYPAIHIDVVLTTRVVDLVGEGFDLALRAGRLADSALIARKIGESRLALFAAPAYLKSAGVPKSLADLKNHQCILFRARGFKSTFHMSGPRRDESVEVTGNLSVDDMAFARDACLAGAGVALLPVELAAKAAQSGRLHLVLPEYYVGGGAVHVVLPSSAFVPSRVALLRDHLVSHIERRLGEAQKDCARQGAPRSTKARTKPS